MSLGEGHEADASVFHEELSQQRTLSMEKSGLNWTQYSYLQYIFIIFGNYCSNSTKIMPGESWYNAKEAGIIMIKKCVIRICIIGDAAVADELLNDFASGPSGDSVKLRTYLPILKSYCDSNICDKAFSMLSRRQDINGPTNYIGKYALLHKSNSYLWFCRLQYTFEQNHFYTCKFAQLSEIFIRHFISMHQYDSFTSPYLSLRNPNGLYTITPTAIPKIFRFKLKLRFRLHYQE